MPPQRRAQGVNYISSARERHRVRAAPRRTPSPPLPSPRPAPATTASNASSSPPATLPPGIRFAFSWAHRRHRLRRPKSKPTSPSPPQIAQPAPRLRRGTSPYPAGLRLDTLLAADLTGAARLRAAATLAPRPRLVTSGRPSWRTVAAAMYRAATYPAPRRVPFNDVFNAVAFDHTDSARLVPLIPYNPLGPSSPSPSPSPSLAPTPPIRPRAPGPPSLPPSAPPTGVRGLRGVHPLRPTYSPRPLGSAPRSSSEFDDQGSPLRARGGVPVTLSYNPRARPRALRSVSLDTPSSMLSAYERALRRGRA